jgi:glutamine amidotransferase
VIALIDYRAGNLTSVKKALASLEADVYVPETPADLTRAAGLIVPGVGHFLATTALDQVWRTAIIERVGEGVPLLGICLGMQWLFEGSSEAPDCPGLGLLGGACYRLGGSAPEGTNGEPVPKVGGAAGCVPGPAAPGVIKIPHVGWNSLTVLRDAAIAEGIAPGAQVYFTHSYVAPVTGDTIARTEHGEAFASIVQRGHVSGVQFHPEKSGEVGLQVLRNFLGSVR